MPQPAEFHVAGVKINALRNADLVDIVDDWVRSGRKEYIVLTGAHGVVEMQGDPELRQINNRAAIVTPDGMPVVWVGKLKGHRNIEKVYAPTIMDALYSAGVPKKHGHFLYGGAEGVADLLKSKLEAAYPGIRIVGTYCPPFRPLTAEEVRAVADAVNRADPQIVWVGLGCPKQERWMHQFRPLLNAPVLIGVGAGFDFLAGRAPLAPKWIQNSGFEWLFRIFYEPRRLLRRYSRVVPLFLYYAAKDALFPSRTRDS